MAKPSEPPPQLKPWHGTDMSALVDVDLELIDPSDSGPLRFQVSTADWSSEYVIRFKNRLASLRRRRQRAHSHHGSRQYGARASSWNRMA